MAHHGSEHGVIIFAIACGAEISKDVKEGAAAEGDRESPRGSPDGCAGEWQRGKAISDQNGFILQDVEEALGEGTF